MSTHSAIESFIVRWSAASGSERANYQLFVTELFRLLNVEMAAAYKRGEIRR